MARPQSIIWFERCFLASIALGALNTAMSWSRVRDLVAATEGAAILPSWFLPVTLIVGIGINLLLWYFAARRSATVAKWVIVVFFGLSVLSIARALMSGIVPPTLNIFAGVAFVLQAVAVWMLFRPDAKAWFARDRTENLTNMFS
jgi:hypothetical protein